MVFWKEIGTNALFPANLPAQNMESIAFLRTSIDKKLTKCPHYLAMIQIHIKDWLTAQLRNFGCTSEAINTGDQLVPAPVDSFLMEKTDFFNTFPTDCQMLCRQWWLPASGDPGLRRTQAQQQSPVLPILLLLCRQTPGSTRLPFKNFAFFQVPHLKSERGVE